METIKSIISVIEQAVSTIKADFIVAPCSSACTCCNEEDHVNNTPNVVSRICLGL